MWFQKLLSFLLLLLAGYGVWKVSGLGKYVKFIDDTEPEETQSVLEVKIQELRATRTKLKETEKIKEIDKELLLLTKKLDKLRR